MLLEKDPNNRPSIADFLGLKMVKQKMEEFVKNRGKNLTADKTIYTKNMPQVVKTKPAHVDPNETPKQRMERRKREQAEQRAKELNQAASGQA